MSVVLCVAASPAPAEGLGNGRPRNSEEIIVTAQRREARLGDVPISMAAFDARSLRRLGAQGIQDIARAVPNFTIAPSGPLGVSQPAIRGIYSPAGSATVSLYVDDVPIQIRSLGFAGSADLRVFDLERVEVLRGPQGTLFGVNSMGGTVRFITQKPDLDQSESFASAKLAATRDGDASYEVQGAMGMPIAGDTMGVRVSAYYRLDGGYIDNLDGSGTFVRRRNVNSVGAIGLRGSLRAALPSGIELMPSILYQRVKRDDSPFFYNKLGAHRQAFVHPQPAEDEFVLPSLTMTADLGAVALTSVTGYLDRRESQVTDYSLTFGELVLGGASPGIMPEGGTRSFSDVLQRNFTQEVRLASATASARLQWVAGAFYRNGRVRLSQRVVEPGIAGLTEEFFGAPMEAVFGIGLLPGGISYRGFEDVDEEQLAGFGEVTWRMTDSLSATAGLRVSKSEVGLEVLSEGAYAGGTATVPETGAQRETPVTPRFGLSYHPHADVLLYASSSKGFRIGGANPPVPAAPCAQDLAALGLSAAPISFKSDRLWSHELGAKASMAAGRLSAALALFQIDWEGIQQTVSLPTCGFSYVDNLGRARSRGFELEAQARLHANLLLTTAIGFVDARFGSTIEVTGADGAPSATIVEQGDRIPHTPRWSVRLAAEYQAGLTARLRGYGRAEYQYSSGYRRAPSRRAIGYNPLTYHGEGYSNVLLRAGVEAGGWEASLFAENLFDDRSILFNSAELVAATGSPLRQSTLRPRTIGMSGLVRF